MSLVESWELITNLGRGWTLTVKMRDGTTRTMVWPGGDVLAYIERLDDPEAWKAKLAKREADEALWRSEC